MRRTWLAWAFGGVALGAMIAARVRARRRTRLAPRLSERVARRLPIAKPLRTIPDARGNYDIDGVSYDADGVVVSGDYSKPGLPL